MKKRFKALMIDVDGTIVENNNMEAVPSQKIRDAIKKAQEKVHVGIVTSRPLFSCRKIFASLELSGPCIVQGGAQIIDGETHKILREHPLPTEVTKKIYKIGQKYNVVLSANGQDRYYPIDKNFSSKNKSYGFIAWPAIERKTAMRMFRELRKIPELATFTSPVGDKEYVFGTYAHATKQHGILEVAELLDIDTHDIIGVGDGYNDFPMMMACGLKVVMGNAEEELKAIADYVAPTVDEDGVVEVIKKFVL